MVERIDGGLAPAAGDIPADDAVPAPLRDQPEGTIVETAPVAAAIMQHCAFRLARQGGAMLAIDYGYSGPAGGDTRSEERSGGKGGGRRGRDRWERRNSR